MEKEFKDVKARKLYSKKLINLVIKMVSEKEE